MPIRMPIGTDISTAIPNPTTTRCTVAHRSANSSPERAMSSPAAHTAPGPGRKVADTAPLAASTTQVTTGTRMDATVSSERARLPIGVRMASKPAVGSRRDRRGRVDQSSRAGLVSVCSVSVGSLPMRDRFT